MNTTAQEGINPDVAPTARAIFGTIFSRRHLGYLRRHWFEFPSRYALERWLLPRLGMEPLTIRNLCQKGWPKAAALTQSRAGADEVAAMDWNPRSNSDGSDLLEDYARESQPLLLRNYVTPPEGGTWSLEWIKRVAGDTIVTIRVGDYESELGDARMVPMRLGTFIDSILDNTALSSSGRVPDGLRPYLGDSPLPVLDRHLSAPRFIGKAAGATRYWMGSSARTAMHCHQSYDFFVQQLVGRRKFILLPPHQALLAGFWPRNPNIAITTYDPFRKDAAQQAEMPDVRPIVVILEPGDALLLPGFWFHAVEVSEPSLSAVVSSANMPAAVGGGPRDAWRDRPWARGW